MINYLRKLNEKHLVNVKSKENLKKYQTIEQLLKDDMCFIKFPIDIAYGILKDLNVPENQIKNVYLALINDSIEEI